MKFMDKLKDLFTDEEEIIETKELEIEEEEHKLPTFMRNKIEEEEKQKESVIEDTSDILNDREIIKTRSNSNFSFPMDVEDEPEIKHFSNQNVLNREKSVSELYTKKEEPKPKRFKPTPVISPVYGVLDKNYTKDEVKVQDENSYEIPRSSHKVDFETVRNKAFGSLTDDIRNNLCENCELYKEVKITKNALKGKSTDDFNLLSDMTDDNDKSDISLKEAEENYFDFGVSYEAPKKENTANNDSNSTVINADKVELEVNNDIKIVNHNEEESSAEKIEVKDPITKEEKLLEDTKEFDKIPSDEVKFNGELSKDEEDINDIFNLMDSMYDEEDK